MYDPADSTNPTWKRYKISTISWWLSLIAIVLVIAYGSEMAIVLSVLAFAVFSLVIAYLPCPLAMSLLGVCHWANSLLHGFGQAQSGACRAGSAYSGVNSKTPNYAIKGDLRGNIRFIRTIIRRVGPLSWLLGPYGLSPFIHLSFRLSFNPWHALCCFSL